MNFNECFEHWTETGDTRYECIIGDTIIEMKIDNSIGDVLCYYIDGEEFGRIEGEAEIEKIQDVWTNTFRGWSRW